MWLRSCSTILAFALAGCLAVAQGPVPYLQPDTLAELGQQGELRRSLSDGGEAELVPDVPQRDQIVEAVRRTALNAGVELLRLYQGSSDYSTPEAHLRIYNILRSISTMEGLEYYSASRRQMRTLFADSYVVDGHETGKPVPDPVAQSIPPHSAATIFQEDLTFGKNYYSASYAYSGDYFVVENRNLTTMRYLLLPMVQPGNSLSVLLVVPAGDRILFYGLSGARTLRFFGLERSKEDSFYNRLQALYGWFTRRLEAAEADPG